MARAAARLAVPVPGGVVDVTTPPVTAVIVTRGDVDLDPIFASLVAHFPERAVLVWDNSLTLLPDLGVYGRYEAIRRANSPIIYVQDDDCIVPVGAVLDAYEPGRLVANMPRSRWSDYPDSCLVGWGAVFDRDLPRQAFQTWYQATLDSTIGGVAAPAWGTPTASFPTPWEAPWFQRECDTAFSALVPRTVIDVGFQHLPWAETPDRLFKQPDHRELRDAMLGVARMARTWPDDVRYVE